MQFRVGCLFLGVMGLLALGCGGGSGKAPGVDGGGTGGAGTTGTPGLRPPPAPLPALPAYTGQIVVTPAALLFTKPGDTATLHAEAFDADGKKVVPTPTFTWETSRATDISVDPNGQATAVTALGSSQIRVRGGGLVSDPVMVIVAEPAAGAVLVSDAQVTAGPAPVDPAALPALGNQVKLTVTGFAALTPGTILLASEGKPVGGRVVSAVAGAAAGDLDVVLETIPLLDLFKRLSVDGDYTIDDAALAKELALHPEPIVGPLTLGPLTPPPDIEVRQRQLMLGRYVKCETMLNLGALTGEATYDLRPQLNFHTRFFRNADDTGWTELMASLDGTLTITGTVALNFAPMAAGTASCSATLAKIPIPVAGALSAVISLQIPLGLKGEIQAVLAAAPLKAGLVLSGKSKVALGFHYTAQGGTTDLSDHENKFEMEPTFTIPGQDSPLVTLSASAAFGGTAGLDLRVIFLGSFSLLEAALMLKAEVKTGGIMSGFAYGTNYDLKPVVEIGAGEDAKKAMQWFGGLVALKPTITMTYPVIAQSPRGTFTADKMKVMPGEPVTLKVELTPASLAIFDYPNVVDVRIYRQARGNAAMGLELVETLTGGPRQGVFSHTFTPTLMDRVAGSVGFLAGVTSKLLPGVAAEVNDMSALSVMVVGTKDPRWKGTVVVSCTEKSKDLVNGDTWSETQSTTMMLEHVTEEDSFMGKVKVTASTKADMLNTHDYTGIDLCGTIMIHEATIGMATTFREALFQMKFIESTGGYAMQGAAYIEGKQHMEQTIMGGCNIVPATTSKPESNYSLTTGFIIDGMVAVGADSFSGSRDFPGDNAESSCKWTWDFARAQ